MARKVVIDGPVVALVGGPLDGQWFTVEDWEERQRAYERMGRPMPYVAYRERLEHPEVPGAFGAVWRVPGEEQRPATGPKAKPYQIGRDGRFDNAADVVEHVERQSCRLGCRFAPDCSFILQASLGEPGEIPAWLDYGDRVVCTAREPGVATLPDIDAFEDAVEPEPKAPED